LLTLFLLRRHALTLGRPGLRARSRTLLPYAVSACLPPHAGGSGASQAPVRTGALVASTVPRALAGQRHWPGSWNGPISLYQGDAAGLTQGMKGSISRHASYFSSHRIVRRYVMAARLR
jgi:hypothetical protein